MFRLWWVDDQHPYTAHAKWGNIAGWLIGLATIAVIAVLVLAWAPWVSELESLQSTVAAEEASIKELEVRLTVAESLRKITKFDSVKSDLDSKIVNLKEKIKAAEATLAQSIVNVELQKMLEEIEKEQQQVDALFPPDDSNSAEAAP